MKYLILFLLMLSLVNAQDLIFGDVYNEQLTGCEFPQVVSFTSSLQQLERTTPSGEVVYSTFNSPISVGQIQVSTSDTECLFSDTINLKTFLTEVNEDNLILSNPNCIENSQIKFGEGDYVSFPGEISVPISSSKLNYVLKCGDEYSKGEINLGLFITEETPITPSSSSESSSSSSRGSGAPRIIEEVPSQEDFFVNFRGGGDAEEVPLFDGSDKAEVGIFENQIEEKTISSENVVPKEDTLSSSSQENNLPLILSIITLLTSSGGGVTYFYKIFKPAKVLSSWVQEQLSTGHTFEEIKSYLDEYSDKRYPEIVVNKAFKIAGKNNNL